MIAAVILAALLVAPVAAFISTSSNWLEYPYPRPGSEGLILYETLLVKHGGDLYAPITSQRFISGPYPPIYYYLVAPLLPTSLPDWANPGVAVSEFRAGREVSLLATLLAAALIPVLVIFEGGYAGRGNRSVWLAGLGGMLGGALLLTLPQVLVWATRFRGDMLMIALTAAGLTAVAVGMPGEQKTGRGALVWLVLAAILFALAIYTKQTGLAGPLGAALYLLARNWKVGLAWCGVMALALLVPFVALDLATGHWFYLKMVDYHSLRLSQSTLTHLLHFAFWDDQWPLILTAVGYAAFRVWQAWRGFPSALQTRSLLIPAFVLASAVTLPTGAVVGADHNHLLMPGLAICACTSALLADLLHRFSKPLPRATFALLPGLATFALLVVYLLVTYQPSPWYDPDLSMPPGAQQEQLRKIVLNVQRNPGTVFFSDDPGILALAGKETTYDDPFTMTALALQGRWDESYYRDMLRTGRFSLLILSCDTTSAKGCRADTFTPGVLQAINDGYRIRFRDVLYTYAPK